jgi:hypothetical protein
MSINHDVRFEVPLAVVAFLRRRGTATDFRSTRWRPSAPARRCGSAAAPERRETAEALAAFEALATKYPRVRAVSLGLGRAAAASNNHPRAVVAFERGIIVVSNPRPVDNLGAAQALLGHVDRALNCLGRAAETGQIPIVAFQRTLTRTLYAPTRGSPTPSSSRSRSRTGRA